MNKHEPPTIGVDYAPKSIVLKDGTIVKAKIWDTGKYKIFNGFKIISWIRKIQSYNHCVILYENAYVTPALGIIESQ